MTTPPLLVAHRGWPRQYPENTVVGLAAALRAGARWLEIDVQLSVDGVPVVLHDADLRRTTGHQGSVLDSTAAALQRLHAGEPERLGGRFPREPLPLLEDVVRLLELWPDAQLFVELKRASLRRFGAEAVLARVLPVLERLGERAIPLSFDAPTMHEVRDRRPGLPLGYVLPGWDEAARALADVLAPDVLFIDRQLLPPVPEPLWPGPWRWAVYTVNDPGDADALGGRGVAFVETDDVGALLAARRERADAV